MTSNLEPTDVGPAVGGDRLVSEADKDQVRRLLQAAHNDGRLTFDELAARRALVEQAQTFDDLIPLTRDLVPIDERTTFTLSSSADGSTSSGTETIAAVFSSASRKGNWLVPKKLNIYALFGGADIDLSRARFEADVCEISVFCGFGGVEITVPDDAQVINRGSGGLFGGVDIVNPDSIDPSKPTIILRGFAFFGGASAKPRKTKKKGKLEKGHTGQ